MRMHEYICMSMICTGCTPSVVDMFRLYCSLESGMTLRDLCERSDLRALGIDERYFLHAHMVLHNIV